MKIWAHVLKHMGNDSSSDVIPALHLLLRLQLLCGVCWSCGCVSALEGQQVLVAHLGGLHRDPHSAHWQEGGQGWESGGQMGHLNVGKPTLSSGLGIFDMWSLSRVSGCAFWFAQFVVLFPGTFREPTGQQSSLSRGCTLRMPVGHGRTKSDLNLPQPA